VRLQAAATINLRRLGLRWPEEGRMLACAEKCYE